jgi:hypothetical protein
MKLFQAAREHARVSSCEERILADRNGYDWPRPARARQSEFPNS